MKHRRRLFSVRNPYDAQSDDIFFNAAKENFIYQYKHCREYRKIADGLSVNEGTLRSIDDLPQLPCLPTLLFKRHHLRTAPALIKATSSGTSGNFSEIGFDIGGLLGALVMSCKIMHRRRLLSPIPCHYIVMGYKPHHSNRTAVTKTAFGATLFAPAIRRRYILQYKNGSYSTDFESIIAALKKLDNSLFPVRFMGFPSYTFFLMKRMDEQGIHIKLRKGSKIMLGGGWKQFYAEQVDKDSFYQLAEKVFGVHDKDIVEFFGAVEHPILYCDCPNHHFHVPAYSRVVIRDIDTLHPVPEETVGLVNLITPMVSATPILSIMTDDLGVLHSGSKCGCGIRTPYLEIIGRVAPTELKTCAAGAAELLKTSQEADK
ncbi:MAG: acyl-protein synthetase [Lachnospiraceae bacterium]|nr:acyl-protein synthetase [Lachnospiraceae bacterium]